MNYSNKNLSKLLIENTPGKDCFKKNLSLFKLKNELKVSEKEIYSYVLTSLSKDNGNIKQNGCGPNLQGKFITLTTCKHYMRSFRTTKNWEDIWIAGFANVNIDPDKNFLFYLMKVKKAFISFKEVWKYLEDYKETQEIKNSSINPYGDIFEPNTHYSNMDEDKETENSYKFYCDPIINHKHQSKAWKKDIYKFYKNMKRRPALLIGDENHSFYWTKPVIYFNKRHPRTKKHDNIQLFIDKLKEI